MIFKKEMKMNLKSFLIWMTLIIVIFLVVFLVYPSIVSNDNIKMIDEMVALFPEEMLKAFNMDIASLDSAFGWLKSEGFVFVLLLTGCYSSILGSTLLLKEENDKAIEYLNNLPVTRKDIVLDKISCGLIYTVLLIIILSIFNFIGLTFSGEFDKNVFWLLSLSPIFSSIVFFTLGMFLSTFTKKTKKMLGISLGIVFISYLLQMLSTIAESVEWLKYLSIFTLADIRNIIQNATWNPYLIIISIILTIVFSILTIKRYENKEFV